MPTPEVTATVSEPIVDTRPEPPSEYPVMYTVQCWRWFSTLSEPRWLPMAHSGNQDIESAEAQAERFIGEGCRNVRIVTVPAGEAP